MNLIYLFSWEGKELDTNPYSLAPNSFFERSACILLAELNLILFMLKVSIAIKWSAALLPLLLFTGCYSVSWNQHASSNQLVPPARNIEQVFEQQPGKVLRPEILAPGHSYIYDVGEKDVDYGNSDGLFRFTKAEIKLHDRMPREKVIVDFVFSDEHNTVLKIPNVDLLRFTPKIDAEGDLIYPEIILEELNRFGLSFRKEHKEFSLKSSSHPEIVDRAYRVSITNNCLDPGKWELAIATEEYGDFKMRKKGGININQNRLLSHSWFKIDLTLYQELLNLKNPGKAYNVYSNFDSISNLAEQVVVDFESLRQPLRMQEKIEILEIGHKSGRVLRPLDIEEHFKWEAGLYLDQPDRQTYTSILQDTVRTAKFMEEGFYRDNTPRVFDFSWLKEMDSVSIATVDVPASDCYAEIKLTGKWSWYEITIGNIDLAQLSEQKLFGLLFGINTYPKSRRYNPSQATVVYDAEMLPDELKPYVLLTEKQSGKWVNNQYKGIEKIYLSYADREKDILDIYVLSYERITPVWMGKVKLSRSLRETVRVRNNLYNY